MGTYAALDLGTSAIKVIVGRMKGPEFVVDRAITRPIDRDGDAETSILSAVASLASEFKKGEAKGARYSVSGKELIIRYTKVPPVPTWRLRLLMDFEVREMAHQAGDTLASDYNLVGVPGTANDEDTVLVAVVKERYLEARHRAIAAAFGEPKSGMPASLALFNSYLHAGSLHEGEFVFLVDIGDRNTEIVLQKDGELLFARNLSAGGGLLTDAVKSAFGVSEEQAQGIKEELGNVTPKGLAAYTSGKEEKVANALIGPVGQLASMIQSSLAFARVQTGVKDLKMGRILLSGGGANLRGLTEYLSSSFGCPVERFQPESGLELSGLSPDEAAEFERDPGRFAIALGLAVTAAKKEAFLVDLVPASTKKKRDFSQKSLFLWASAAACLAFLVLHFFNMRAESQRTEDDARKLRLRAQTARRQSEEFQTLRQEIDELNSRQVVLQRETESAYAMVRAQRLVQDHIGDGIWIEQIDVRRQSLQLEGGDGRKKESKTLAVIDGEVVSIDVQTTSALQDFLNKIKTAAPDVLATIRKQEGGEGVGAKKTRFQIGIDAFPTAPAVPVPNDDAKTGGN